MRAAWVRDWVGPCAFFCGLVTIGAACGVYIIYDRLPVAAALPPALAKLYAGSGKTGVALAAAFAGLTLMLVGAAIPRSKRPVPTPASNARAQATATPYYMPPDRPEIEPSVTSYGRVILRTERYVAAKSRASDRAAPRKPG
jgi:hypothetical protein